MSGPSFPVYSGGALGGLSITTVMLNGVGGEARLDYDWETTESIFNLYIDGRLRLKEVVCKDNDTAYDEKCIAAGYPRTNTTRTEPP